MPTGAQRSGGPLGASLGDSHFDGGLLDVEPVCAGLLGGGPLGAPLGDGLLGDGLLGGGPLDGGPPFTMPCFAEPAPEAPRLKPGSAWAARSAFRKTYARQLLPLCDEKPVLDFSAYTARRSPSPPRARAGTTRPRERAASASPPKKRRRRIYAGLVLTGIRGMSLEVERARARLTQDFFASLRPAAQRRGRPARLAKKDEEDADPMRDPWGTALAACPLGGSSEALSEALSPRSGDGRAQRSARSAVAKRMPCRRRAKEEVEGGGGALGSDAVPQGPQGPQAGCTASAFEVPPRRCRAKDEVEGVESPWAWEEVRWQPTRAQAKRMPLRHAPLQALAPSPPPPPLAPPRPGPCGLPPRVEEDALGATLVPSWDSWQVAFEELPDGEDAAMGTAVSVDARAALWPFGNGGSVALDALVPGVCGQAASFERPPPLPAFVPYVPPPSPSWAKAIPSSWALQPQPPPDMQVLLALLGPAPLGAVPPPLPFGATAAGQGAWCACGPCAAMPAPTPGAASASAPRPCAARSPSWGPGGAAPPRGAEQEVRLARESLPTMLAAPLAGREHPLKFDDSNLNAVQCRLVKELAGGVSRLDPARDRGALASRDQARNASLVDVKCLRFCHVAISPSFSNGTHRGLPVLSLLEELHSGRARPEELPPLLVMKTREGLLCLCGHRRLYCLKRFSAEAGQAVSTWCVVYDLLAQDTPRNLVMKYILARTTEDGGSIRLRDV